MHVFIGETRTFELSLSLHAVTRIKAHLGLDLLRPETPDAQGQVPLLRLYSEPEILLQAVGLVLHQQLKEAFASELARGLTDEITGQPLMLLDLLALECTAGRFEQLRAAFFEEIRDFFRQIGLPEKAALIFKQMQMIGESKQALAEKITDLDIEQAVDQVRNQDLQTAINQQFVTPGNL